MLECIWGKKNFSRPLHWGLEAGDNCPELMTNKGQRHTQQNSPKSILSGHECFMPCMSVLLTEPCLWWCWGLLEGSVSGSSGLVGQDHKWTCKSYPICPQSLRLQTDPDGWLSSVRKILRAHRALETYLLIYKLWAWIILLASVSRRGLESLWCLSLKNRGCKFFLFLC